MIEELLTAIQTYQVSQVSSGVLLTGPNGVGKSAIGLQAFLCCQALGHLSVHISDPKSWIKAAEVGRGDEYLLEEIFRQNVDRIASMPTLRGIFHDRFRGVPVHAAMMDELLEFLVAGPGPWPAVALFVDEVQHISNAIAQITVPTVTQQERTGGAYFQKSWSTWNISTGRFIRMDIASSHGMREFKLCDGDQNRLRFVRPWPLEIARVALAHRLSPVFVKRTKAHERIIHIAGGVIRKLMQCHEELLPGAVTKASLFKMEHAMRMAMSRDCYDWLKLLSEAEQHDVARKIIPLLQSKVSWDMAKGAYDHGLVALTTSDVYVQPISPVAGSIIHQQLSNVLRDMMPVSLSSIDFGSERGYELERQMLIRLAPCAMSIETKCLQVARGSGLAAHLIVDHVLLFHEPKDTVMSESLSTLYIPDRSNYPCDGIIVPAVRSGDDDGAESELIASPVERALNPVLVLEHSVTDPRDSERVKKIDKWFSPGALIDKVKAAHPGRPITILLSWPAALLEKSDHKNPTLLDDLASKADVKLFVIDSVGLSKLGVVI